MTYDPNKHHRKSIRLQGFDYAKDGFFFITICTHRMRHTFGKVTNGKMDLTPLGQAAHRCWQEIPAHYPHVALHEFVIMPNHMHGILQLKSGNDFTTNENARHEFQKVIPRSISSVVRGYKIGVTKWYLNDGGGSGVVGGAGVTGGSDGGVGGPHGPNDDSGGSGRKFSAPTLPDPDVKSNVPSQIIPHANTPHYAAPHPIPHLATQFL